MKRTTLCLLIAFVTFGMTSCGSDTDTAKSTAEAEITDEGEKTAEETNEQQDSDESEKNLEEEASDASVNEDNKAISVENSEENINTEENTDLIEIETDYGTLYYPGEWEDSLSTKTTEEDNILTVTFDAKIDEEEYQLFKVMICNKEGDSVGTITDSSGTARNVFVEIFELEDIDSLSEDVQNQLYAMQEGVNALTEALK